MSNIFPNDYVSDELVDLDNLLTKEYDLSELISFFQGAKENEDIGFGDSSQLMHYDYVNQLYPVEVTRPLGGYSIYRVKQGGYYYVFWSQSINVDVDSNPFVYFTAYLSGTRSPKAFSSIEVGVSTAKDIQKIDPSLELTFLMSCGIFSYSFLDEQTILEVEYIDPGSINEYKDLVVKNVTVIPRQSSSSRYGGILSSDLPH